MKKVKLIVAITENYAIGKGGGLIFNIREDMKRFREKTSGGVVIMGRNTYESLPHGALPNRINYVVSSKSGKDTENLIFVHSVEEAIDNAVKNYPERDIWVIGGGQIYRYCLEKKLVDELHITRFHRVVEDATIWFPTLDKEEWKQTQSEAYNDKDTGMGVSFEVWAIKVNEY